MVETVECDVVIIGAGAAGMAAAVGACEAGPPKRPRVVVVDRAPEAERGGNTRWTSSYLRIDPHTYEPRGLKEDFVRFSGTTDGLPQIDRLIEEAPGTVRWLEAKGVKLESGPTYFLTSSRPRVYVSGGGNSILECLEHVARQCGVAFEYETQACGLTVQDGHVCGVSTNRRGQMVNYAAKSVVICCGGFEGDRELLRKYAGPVAAGLRTVAPGGRFNQGDGIRLGLEAGAALAGELGNFHCEPVDPRSNLAEALVMGFPYGILLNGEGRRFVDEGSGTVDEIYEDVTRAIASQPEGLAYFVADQKFYEVEGWQRSMLTDRAPFEARDVTELGRVLGVDEVDLAATLEDYNASVPSDSSCFRPEALDGLAARQSLHPPKSNWARALDRPPFLVWPVSCAIVFTFGGLMTDAEAHVLGGDGHAIPGLFAAGEVTGLYHRKYPGATSVLRSVVFGRIAGRGAACRAA